MGAFDRFYNSQAWKNCRNGYAKSRRYLCERCLARGLTVPGEIVHHKKHLTPESITDPTVALSWDNLQLLCRDCHGEMHKAKKRYDVAPDGKISARSD